ncbi:MAG TPA: hypothetical protein VN693_06465 [Rhodanobacteraceae bacterium]|nr:hypothetical protein [Rhodanobacteraceae bacterium]
MDMKITEDSTRCLTALFKFERTGRAEDKARFEAALAALGSRPGSANHLGMVPNCGSLVQTRIRDDEFSEMAFYARNIRAMREGKIDCVQHRPKLTLVHSD